MTYLFGIGIIILQVALAVHAIRTGRPFTWVFLIVVFPLVGSLVYLIAELIPEWERQQTLDKWLMKVGRFVSDLFSRR